MSNFFDYSDENFDEVVDPKPVPEGEYTIQIMDFKADDEGNIILKNKSGNPYVLPLIDVVDCEEAVYAQRFSHYMGLPHGDMDKKQKNACLADNRKFYKAFGVDPSQRVNFEDMIGLKADAILIVKKDIGYGEQNAISKFIAPR